MAAIVSRYQSMRAGHTLSDADRDRLRQYRRAYRGTQAALVDKYMALMDGRN